jgi:hypothetical protein
LWILIYWRVMGEHDGKQVGYISILVWTTWWTMRTGGYHIFQTIMYMAVGQNLVPWWTSK